jgi:hypothetical protein
MKLYRCEVETVLYVCAEHSADAERLARDYAPQEEAEHVAIVEVGPDHNIPGDWLRQTPYNNPSDTTIEQILPLLGVQK